MLFSRALIPTMKEAPADATNASHVLLSRAGYIRRVGAGIYDFLPLGYRVLRKVEAIVREEMDRAGALEPGVHPVPGALDREVAALKLASLDVAIDTLTPEQEAYLRPWEGRRDA